MSAAKTVEFLNFVGKLKKIPRTGWILRNIKEPESVAGHMYRMAIMTMLIPSDSENTMDVNKCLKLSIVHDIAECIVGDLTPYCSVSADEKHRREDEAVKKLSNLIGESGEAISLLYNEYATQKSQEARFVKELDRLDMVLQAFEYEVDTGSAGNLQEFFDSTKDKFSHPWSVKIINEIYRQRSAHMAENCDLTVQESK